MTQVYGFLLIQETCSALLDWFLLLQHTRAHWTIATDVEHWVMTRQGPELRQASRNRGESRHACNSMNQPSSVRSVVLGAQAESRTPADSQRQAGRAVGHKSRYINRACPRLEVKGLFFDAVGDKPLNRNRSTESNLRAHSREAVLNHALNESLCSQGDV